MQQLRMSIRAGALAVCVMSTSVASAALAQGKGVERRQARRAQLEQQYRDRVEQAVRTRLNLNDDQMRQLRRVNADMEKPRRELAQEERTTRQALRAEVALHGKADQKRVSELMNQLQRIQERRLALQDQERKHLGFLSPVQQAQYFGLQAQLRKRAQELEDEQEKD